VPTFEADPECVENTDCPNENPWCCDDGHCAYDPTFCNDGECTTDAHCKRGQCCSTFGYCQPYPSPFCEETTLVPITTQKLTTPPKPTTTGNLTTTSNKPTTKIIKDKEDCETNADCPKDTPWCCYDGYCVGTPVECHDGECASDADCENGMCCSLWGYCQPYPNPACPETSVNPVTGTTTTTPRPTTTTDNSECHTLADCPADRPWCCDKDFCVADPADCGDGECTDDADCPLNKPCCSKYGYCGSDPEYCN